MRVALVLVLAGLVPVTLVGPSSCFASDRPTVVAFGDSISAGHGVALKKGWVAHVRQRVSQWSTPPKIINASVSGETTQGGRERLPDALDKHQPDLVLLELGGNDGLRSQRLDRMRRNLEKMIAQIRAHDARVLMLGIRLPPNYGTAYVKRFAGVFRKVADATGVAFLPRILKGVGGDPTLMQADGIHPNAAGHARIAKHVWPMLEPMLKTEKN